LRIDGYAKTGGVAGRGAVRSSAGSTSAFVLGDSAPAARAAATAPAAAPAALDALLALQAVEDPLFKKKKAVRRGKALLDVLEEMKADLLVGRIGEGRLNQLLALIGQAREKSDPDLDALIDDIELRARVELAKLGQFPG
jgi:hypothetical protein